MSFLPVGDVFGRQLRWGRDRRFGRTSYTAEKVDTQFNVIVGCAWRGVLANYASDAKPSPTPLLFGVSPGAPRIASFYTLSAIERPVSAHPRRSLVRWRRSPHRTDSGRSAAAAGTVDVRGRRHHVLPTGGSSHRLRVRRIFTALIPAPVP